MLKYQYCSRLQELVHASKVCETMSNDPTYVKLPSYLLQMTEGLMLGSDRLGAL